MLGLSEADQVSETWRANVLEPGPSQRQLPAVAARFFPSLLCAAVQRVVFIDGLEPGSGTLGWVRVAGDHDLVHLSGASRHLGEARLDPEGTYQAIPNLWAGGIDTLVHEGTHAATHLLHTQIVPGDCFLFGVFCDEPTAANQWGPEAIETARRASERARLGGGFRAEWERMHEAFAEEGMAAPYGRALESELPPRTYADAGVMTGYGLTSASEDIAEMVAKTLVDDAQIRVNGAVTSAPPEDYGCRALAGVDAIQSWNAALVTKLGFLADVGLIDEAALERCTGGLAVDVGGVDGFHTYTLDGQFQRSYGGDLDVSMGVQSSTGRTVLAIDVDGVAEFADFTSPARLRLVVDLAPDDADIDRVSWPRGIYRLGDGATQFLLEFEHEDASGGSFLATEGLVLITRASSERIEGSIVVQAAQRIGMGVPLSRDELRRVTFRVTSGR